MRDGRGLMGAVVAKKSVQEVWGSTQAHKKPTPVPCTPLRIPIAEHCAARLPLAPRGVNLEKQATTLNVQMFRISRVGVKGGRVRVERQSQRL